MVIELGSKGRPEDFINEAERSTDPTLDEGRVAKLENDGKLSPAFTSSVGDASDGDVDFDGTNTFSFASKSGSTYTLNRDVYGDTVTIPSGSIVNPAGWRIFCATKITGTGKIQWKGENGGDGSSSGGGVPGNTVAGFFENASGIKGMFGINNQDESSGDGETSCLGTKAPDGGSGYRDEPNEVVPPGTGGQASIGTKFGMSRALTTVPFDVGFFGFSKLSVQPVAGGGGVGIHDNTNKRGGGASGCSGGISWIVAYSWEASLEIELIGGNGGDGEVLGGGGAGGNGGVSVGIYFKKSGTNTYTLTGGTGGIGYSDGDNGNTGKSYEINVNTLL